MKKAFSPFIFLIITITSAYILLPSCKEKQSGNRPITENQSASKMHAEAIDTLQKIKEAFCDTSNKELPALDSNFSIYLVNKYLKRLKGPKQKIDKDTAKTKIRLYRQSQNADYVKSVWVNIEDIISLLGVKDGVDVNQNKYDGFRFYFAKTTKYLDSVPAGITTLVMVATKNRRDVVDEGLYNKFDPCPPLQCDDELGAGTNQ